MKVKVPVYGTVGKSVLIDTTTGATIGTDFRLPDGSIPTLAQLKVLFASNANQQAGSPGTFWKFIQEIPNSPLSVIGTPGLSSGIPVAIAAADNDTVLARVSDGLSWRKLTLPTIPDKLITYAKIQDATALSVLGRAANSDGVLDEIVASADKAVVHRDGTAVSFSPVDHTYISDFTEAVQDVVGLSLVDSADIVFDYGDSDGSITARLSASIHAILAEAETAVQPGDLAPIAFTGYYSDLVDPPFIPVNLDDLDDVHAAYPNDGDALTWDSSFGAWVPLPGSGGVDHLADLLDVDVTGVLDGQFLSYDSGTSKWVPVTGSGGGGTVDSVVAGTDIAVDSTDPANPIVALTSGAQASLALADSAVQPGDLATVAFTGAYADLSGKPTIPTVTPSALTKTDDTNVTLTLGGTPATALLQAASLTLGWTGTLAVARGGSGAGTLTGYLKGNGTSAFTASATIPYSDLTGAPTPSALTKVDDTNVTLTLGGTPATALIQAASLTLGWTGQLAVARGGSGAATLTGYLKGNGTSAFTASATIPYSDITGGPAAYTPAALTKTDDTNVTLTLGGTPATALLQASSLTLGWTGQLAVARGGSGAATLTGYLKGNGTSAFTASATIPYSDLTGTPTIPTGANPSASLGLAAVNGSATTFMRSDGAPALSQSIAPTWTGVHTYSALTGRSGAAIVINNNGPTISLYEADAAANNRSWFVSVSAEQLQFGVANDADSSFANYMTVDRTAQTIDFIKLSGAVQCIGSNASPPASGASLYASAPSGGVSLTLYGSSVGAAGHNIDFYDNTNSVYRGFIGFGTSTVGGAAVTDFGISPGGSGKLLIGTANGAAICAAFDSGAERLALYAADSIGDCFLRFRTAAGGTKGYVGYGESSDDNFYIDNQLNKDMYFATNDIVRMRLLAAGQLVINQSALAFSGTSLFEVTNTGNGLAAAFMNNGTNETIGTWNKATSGTNNIVSFYTEASATLRGTIQYNRAGGVIAYNTTSDQRLKKNIVDAPSASSIIDSIKVRSFDWRDSGTHVGHWFVAQELYAVAPLAVTVPNDPAAMWAVDPAKLVPLMVKELQSLRQRVKVLESTQN